MGKAIYWRGPCLGFQCLISAVWYVVYFLCIPSSITPYAPYYPPVFVKTLLPSVNQDRTVTLILPMAAIAIWFPSRPQVRSTSVQWFDIDDRLLVSVDPCWPNQFPRVRGAALTHSIWNSGGNHPIYSLFLRIHTLYLVGLLRRGGHMPLI